MKVRVRYFASMRDAAGCEAETVDASGPLHALYADLAVRHGFAMSLDRVRVARNGAFAAWTELPCDDDEIAFIPPVSGG